MRTFHLVFTVFLLSVIAVTAQAQIPRTLSYQGILTDTSDTPKPNGTYGVTFRLYNTASGGSPIWSETKTLQVRRGLFSTVLGDVTPFAQSVAFDRQYWLSIQIAPDPELSPRIPLSAVGYSFNSAKADTARYALVAPAISVADSARIAGTVPNNSITSAKIASGQVVKSLNGVRDAVTFRAQGGATITSSGDTITINAGTGGGGTGIQGVQNTNSTLDIINPGGPTATVNVKVPLTLSGNVNANNTLSVFNTSTNGHGILGSSHASVNNSSGVAGTNDNGGWGVFGNSNGFAGVFGFGSQNGVYGLSSAASASGVYGSNNGTGYGVSGSSTDGVGVYGISTNNDGIVGTSSQSNKSGVWGHNDLAFSVGVAGSSTFGDGVSGTSTSGKGVVGASANNDGIQGTAHVNNMAGVFGFNDGNGYGVYGSSTAGVGVKGASATNDGVVGSSSTANKSGVWGHNDVAGGVGVAGSSTSGTGVSGTSTNYDGVQGASTNRNGVYGVTNVDGATGVYGYNNATQTSGSLGVAPVHQVLGRIPTGVFGDTPPSAYGYAIWGRAHNVSQQAGHFDGSVQITTDLFVMGEKYFKIDHPLDPTNKYLLHSCVESNDQMNIYNGNVTTDAKGEAAIELPNWFEALNIDFRYQLTILGDEFAQARVSKKINGNKFSIKTDKPNIEVSWQVTGVRNDAYAKAHPMKVEVEKPAHEKGTYTHPELYGLPPRTFDALQPEHTTAPTKKEKQ